MMNDAVNQVQKQATDIVQKQATDIVTGNKGSSGTDELIYRMNKRYGRLTKEKPGIN